MVESAAVKTAKARREQKVEAGETLLSTGVRARLTPVSATLVQDVISRIKDPEIPTWYNKEKEQDEPNPADPKYLAACAEVEQKRVQSALDAAVMFGVELLDGVPDVETDPWLKRLRYLAEKRHLIDLSEFDLDDEMDREFLYKRYVAVAADDYAQVVMLSGVPAEEVERATRTFRG